MSKEPRPQPIEYPADLQLDRLTCYIYRHFPNLLTEEECSAHRLHFASTQLHAGPWNPEAFRKNFRISETEQKYPDLMRRIEQLGLSRVMSEAAHRVVRDNPERQLLHTCSRCGGLCRTPVAKQCFDCGYDWHEPEAFL